MSSAPKKLLYVATTVTAGGIATASTRFAHELLERGNELVYVCAPTGAIREQCVAYDIPTDTLLPKNSGDLSAVLKVASLVKNYQPDIVHIHSRRDYVPVALGVKIGAVGMRKAPKIILHLHLNHVMGKPPVLAGKFFQRFTDRAIAVSETVRKSVIAAHNLAPSYVETVYNGIDMSQYLVPGSEAFSVVRTEGRRMLGIPENGNVIGIVGRYDAKGQISVIENLELILAQVPNLTLVLIGVDHGDRGGRSYGEVAQSAGVADHVVIMGLVPDVPSTLPLLDVLVHLPSDEAFGLALVEAMAAGLPVVTTDIDGCREVIELTGGGVTVPLGDVTAASAAIAQLFTPSSGDTLRAEYAAQGRKAVATKLTMAAQVDALEALYARV